MVQTVLKALTLDASLKLLETKPAYEFTKVKGIKQ
jgi:hypothetical protein